MAQITTTTHPVHLQAVEAREVLDELMYSLELMMREVSEGDWSDDTLERVAARASAVGTLALAVGTAPLHHGATCVKCDRLRRAAERSLDVPAVAPAPQPPQAAAPLVKPSTVDRLRSLREEFGEDPAGIDLLIEWGEVWAGQARPGFVGALREALSAETPAPA